MSEDRPGWTRYLGDFRGDEFGRAALLQAQFGLIVFALLLARTVRDALYLSRTGVDGLPYMYVGVSVLTTAATLVYTRFLAGREPVRLAPWVQFLFAATFAGFAGAISYWGGPLYAALYLWVEVLTAISVIQFWNVTNTQFHPRQAKRLYGFIAAGQAIGNLACGVVASGAGVWISVEELLWVVAAVTVVAGLFYLGRNSRPVAAGEGQPDPRISTRQRRDSEAVQKRYGIALVVLVACTYLGTSWVDFQFKVIARRTFNEAELTRFFGQFYAAVGIASFVIQFALLRNIARFLGLFGSLALMPVLFVALGGVLPIAPSLWVATGLKFSENGLRYAVYDPLLQTLYLPLPAATRAKLQSMAGGVVKPLAMGLAGALLIPLRPDQPGGLRAEWLGIPVAIVAAVVLVLLLRLRAGYLKVLVQDTANNILQRGAREPVRLADAGMLVRLLAMVVTGGRGAINWVLERVQVDDPETAQAMTETVIHREDLPLELRTRTLLKFLSQVEAAFGPLTIDDPYLNEIARVSRGQADWQRLNRFLDERDPDVLEATLVYMFASNDPEAVLQARDNLLILANGSRVSDRKLAVRLGHFLHEPERRQALALALEDPREDIIAEALAALAAKPDPAFLPQVVAQLGRWDFKHHAVHALAAHGQAGLDAVRHEEARGDAPMDAPWRRMGMLWRTFAREADGLDWAELSDTLVEWESDPIFWPPTLIAAAQAGQRPGEKEIETMLQAAREAAHVWYAMVERLEQQPDDAAQRLLLRAARDRLTAATHAVLATLFLGHPPKVRRWDRLLVNHLWEDKRARQNLAEIVDESVSGPQKAVAIQLLEMRFDPPAVEADIFLELVRPLPQLARRVWHLDMEEAGMLQDVIERVLFLSSVPLFRNLGGEDLEQIAEIMEPLAYDPETTFIRRGERGDSLYLITDGRVRVLVGDQQVAELGPGAVVGELALLDNEPRSADVRTDGPVRVLRLERADFEQLLDAYPQMSRSVMQVLTERLRKANPQG